MIEFLVLDTIYFSCINDDCTKINLTWINEFNCLDPREPMVLAKFHKSQVTSYQSLNKLSYMAAINSTIKEFRSHD